MLVNGKYVHGDTITLTEDVPFIVSLLLLI